jgi:hypothetical protein
MSWKFRNYKSIVNLIRFRTIFEMVIDLNGHLDLSLPLGKKQTLLCRIHTSNWETFIDFGSCFIGGFSSSWCPPYYSL